MPRTCFVIMPFSKTATCSEEEWAFIFEKVLRPSIEGAGLDYICRRSVATRGNIVGAILRDLNDSHVILADLTDRNANVFYELGVRHALKDRSILIAQKREDIDKLKRLTIVASFKNWQVTSPTLDDNSLEENQE